LDISSLLGSGQGIFGKVGKTLDALEELNRVWVMDDVPVSEHPYGRFPDETEIRLWAIPRASIEVLAAMAIARRCKTILDIGTSGGYSALWLGLAAYLNGGHVWTVDIFEPKVALAREHVRQSGLGQHITIVQGDAGEFLRGWDGPKVDLVLLDADADDYLSYQRSIEHHLAEDALVAADNATNLADRMADFISHMSTSESFVTFRLDLPNGLLLAVHGPTS